MEIYRVSFIGHREVYRFREVEERLEEVIYALLHEKEYVEFYVGRNGDFDILVASIVKKIQKNFGKHNNCLTLVLPYPVRDMEYYEEYYDEIYMPISQKTHYKNAIIKRNEWMIENSEMLICYVENNFGNSYKYMKKAVNLRKDIINIIEDENKKSE